VILPDVNILVHAFRADTTDHETCRRWLMGVVNGQARFGISPQVLSSVVRITTHPKVFIQPSGLPEVLRFCAILLELPHCVPVQPGARHWEIFTNLCLAADARGNLAADAWFAALAMEWGCDWITMDRDYARFPGLRWRLPE
jgi:toxin-antitoxin system PIN domain toxin